MLPDTSGSERPGCAVPLPGGGTALLGYPCQNLTLGRGQRSMRLATLRAGGLAALQEIVDHNLLLPTEILEWNRAQGIAMFRISSDLVPFSSHDAVDLAEVRFEPELLSRIADATAGVRLSMHPGQFTVLSTADPKVLQASVAELRYHAAILARLGLSGDLVLHGGGVYGGRPAAAERLVRQIRGLPDDVRGSVCLEGDERAWSVEQLLPICEEAGVPLIVDTLHHALNGVTPIDQLPWPRIRGTWGDRTPKIHYSEQDLERRAGAHSAAATSGPFLGAIVAIGMPSFDVMLEGKGKDRALLDLVAALEGIDG